MSPITRRRALQGIGATLALPWMESLSRAAAVPDVPQRIAWFYTPNGVIGDQWFPTSAGKSYKLTPTLEPLAKVKSEINVISNLNRVFLIGEPHSQAGSCWLTQSRPEERKDGATAIDRTLDQVIAHAIGDRTAFPSIELSCNSFVDHLEPKIFDAISWYGPGNDAKSMNDPRQVFKRLFGKSELMAPSVLDAVLEDAQALQQKLGQDDRHKLGEYLESVRSIERRLERQSLAKSGIGTLDFELPEPIPTHRGEYIRLMCDLMVLAFQTDQTRIATLMVGPERWETPQLYEGVFDRPVGHHVMTHDRDFDQEVAQIDRFHVAQFAYLVDRLRQIPEGEGTLLDQCGLIMGSGIGDGATHSYKQLPLVTAGSLGGTWSTGQHVVAPEETPLANFWLATAQHMGVNLKSFADSTGQLEW